MDEIVAELKRHRDALNRAIEALTVRKTDKPRPKVSAAVRRKIAAGMRKRWAERKKG